ncbi:TlpA disulfide reductase family protein [Nocardioides sp.]|uniref:TlpA family protein disulfide reductase n=1 Tax=Nocardioides sp. TaxID=35761 RepID=UPI00286E95D3|nr:TlpA disulfide reductase family protein [Nocardioides sp.]
MKLRLIALLIAVLATGCSSLQGTGDKGYISGDGQITTIDPADRGEPITLTGEDLDGNELSLEDLRGRVVVVNYWWSACPPCRVEQPGLNEAATELGDAAAFVGINIRDLSADNGLAYVRTFDVPYPSIYDPSGRALLAFAGVLSRNAIPSTLVLDEQGRVAATVIGSVPGTRTIPDLVEDIDGETSG